MFIRAKKKPNGKTAVQIVESHRVGYKVSQKIVRHIGQGQTEREVEELKKLGRSIIKEIKNQRQPNLPLFDPQTILETPSDSKTDETRQINIELGDLREEQRIIDGIGDVFGKLYKDLGFNNILRKTRKNSQWNAILKSCVLARVANPVSKRRTASMLEQDYGVRIPLEKIYKMMNHVTDQEEDIKNMLSRYRELWRIEEAFRISRHDLKMRPIYHWGPERIKAHIAICFLAFTLVKQALRRARIQYMPMSFEKLRNELLHAKSSIMYDIKSRVRFRMPSKVTKNQRRIYQVFGPETP